MVSTYEYGKRYVDECRADQGEGKTNARAMKAFGPPRKDETKHSDRTGTAASRGNLRFGGTS
jgi:hypothetical protein